MGSVSSSIKELPVDEKDPKVRNERSLFTAFPQVENIVTLESATIETPTTDILYDTLCTFTVTVDDEKDSDKVLTKELIIEYYIALQDGKQYEICLDYDNQTFDIMYNSATNTFDDQDYCEPQVIKTIFNDLSIELTRENIEKLIQSLVIEKVPEVLLKRISEIVM